MGGVGAVCAVCGATAGKAGAGGCADEAAGAWAVLVGTGVGDDGVAAGGGSVRAGGALDALLTGEVEGCSASAGGSPPGRLALWLVGAEFSVVQA